MERADCARWRRAASASIKPTDELQVSCIRQENTYVFCEGRAQTEPECVAAASPALTLGSEIGSVWSCCLLASKTDQICLLIPQTFPRLVFASVPTNSKHFLGTADSSSPAKLNSESHSGESLSQQPLFFFDPCIALKKNKYIKKPEPVSAAWLVQ